MDEKAHDIDYEYASSHNTLESLLRLYLSWLTDPDIEQRGPCTLDCCVGNGLPSIFEILLLWRPELVAKIIGVSGMELLAQFAEAVDDAVYFDEGPKAIGWSQQPGWIEFVTLSKKLQRHIRKALRHNKKDVAISRKYPTEYLADFIKDYVGYIAQHNKLPDHLDTDFFVRCHYILRNPDEYEGLTWSLFNLIDLLYTLTQSAYVGNIDGLKSWYGGRWHRDETVDYYAFKDLRENAFTSDNRIAECAQLIIDEFEKNTTESDHE